MRVRSRIWIPPDPASTRARNQRPRLTRFCPAPDDPQMVKAPHCPIPSVNGPSGSWERVSLGPGVVLAFAMELQVESAFRERPQHLAGIGDDIVSPVPQRIRHVRPVNEFRRAGPLICHRRYPLRWKLPRRLTGLESAPRWRSFPQRSAAAGSLFPLHFVFGISRIIPRPSSRIAVAR
jgi:hypothetical protein